MTLSKALMMRLAAAPPASGIVITGSLSTTWDPASGPLSLATGGFYYLTPNTNYTLNVKMWGAAGGKINAGAGGYAGGIVTLSAGQTYLLIVGSGGSALSEGAGGGGFSAIFSNTTQSQVTAWLMAGGGGGGMSDPRTGFGGAGGGTNGQNLSLIHI